MEALLEFKNVMKHFPISAGGLLRKKNIMLKAVDGVTFSVDKGACFGIAGESGSGKTTLAKLILLLETITSGSILFEGKDVQRFTNQDIMWYRGRVQTIFQDAASSLNPRMRIGDIVGEPIEVQNHGKLPKKQIRKKAEEILGLVGLDPSNVRNYPHELSGGQKQRVAIARAIVLEPSLVVLDEHRHVAFGHLRAPIAAH